MLVVVFDVVGCVVIDVVFDVKCMLYGFGYLLFVVDLCLLYMCGWFVVCGFDGGYVMLFDVCCV